MPSPPPPPPSSPHPIPPTHTPNTKHTHQLAQLKARNDQPVEHATGACVIFTTKIPAWYDYVIFGANASWPCVFVRHVSVCPVAYKPRARDGWIPSRQQNINPRYCLGAIPIVVRRCPAALCRDCAIAWETARQPRQSRAAIPQRAQPEGK